MGADFIFTLPEKGSRLLRVIVAEIKSGRIKKREPASFISYSEALQQLSLSPHGRAGQQLQREGLNELNDWTREHNELPKIAGLIVDKRRHEPAAGFAKSHGMGDLNWREWWLRETDRAIEFDWSPFLRPSTEPARVRETPASIDQKLIERITFDAAVMGGKPCIRGLRVTVGTIVGLLAAGHSNSKVLELYPYLEREDIDAALKFAAWRAEERELPLTHA